MASGHTQMTGAHLDTIEETREARFYAIRNFALFSVGFITFMALVAFL